MPYVCPKCETVQDVPRLPPWYPWRLHYTFRCQTCATMLRLHRSQSAVICARVVSTAMVGLFCSLWEELPTDLPLIPRTLFHLAILVGLMLLCLATWIPPQCQPVVHSDE